VASSVVPRPQPALLSATGGDWGCSSRWWGRCSRCRRRCCSRRQGRGSR
jgi:hypothetical protein